VTFLKVEIFTCTETVNLFELSFKKKEEENTGPVDSYMY